MARIRRTNNDVFEQASTRIGFMSFLISVIRLHFLKKLNDQAA